MAPLTLREHLTLGREIVIYVLKTDRPGSPDASGLPTRVRLVGPFETRSRAASWRDKNNQNLDPCHMVDISTTKVLVESPNAEADKDVAGENTHRLVMRNLGVGVYFAGYTHWIYRVGDSSQVTDAAGDDYFLEAESMMHAGDWITVTSPAGGMLLCVTESTSVSVKTRVMMRSTGQEDR